MFIAAMLDIFPELAAQLENQIELAGFPDLVSLHFEDFNDGILSGQRFKVGAATDAEGHGHRHHREIKTLLWNSKLDAKTTEIALSLFEIIAIAEAKIHGKEVEDIVFHEVGAWDSIADIVCSSYLISKVNLASISHSSLPLGGGRITTAHGLLPVPAPATSLILKGFQFYDDGITGERITPTGAAILKYLCTHFKTGNLGGTLDSQGFGFGSKKMKGASNVLRILRFQNRFQDEAVYHNSLSILEFEIDDQSPEELAIGLDKIRNTDGVIDVIQYAILGKKNRLGSSIRVLCSQGSKEAVTLACFRHTTTIGLRHSIANRSILEREENSIEINHKSYRVKTTNRPEERTAKVEIDDLISTKSQGELTALKQTIELFQLNQPQLNKDNKT